MTSCEEGAAGAARDAALMLQAFDSVVPDGEGSYLAAPITTGPRYFRALDEYGAADLAGLLAAAGEEYYLRAVRRPNVAEGLALAARLRRASAPQVIYTGPIYVAGWTARDYMKFCFELIGRKVARVYFHPDWAYSAGAVEEYLFCLGRGLTLLTVEGEPLTPRAALAGLERARDDLRGRALPCGELDVRIEEARGRA